MQVLPLQLNLYNMKKLLLLLLLTPFFANAQVVNTILRKNTATKEIYSYSSGSAGNDTLANVYKLSTFTDGQVPSWDAINKRFKASTVSLSGIKTFVFSRGASDISGYEQAVALNSYVEGLRDTATVTATTSGVLMQEFATNIGFPNMTVIQPGEFRVYYETKKASGGQNYWTYAVVLKRSLAGTETVIDTTEISTVTDLNTLQNVSVSFLIASNISLLTTDRLVVKIYARMQSSTASIDLYYDDATYARLTIPSSSVDATNFVPYVGATKDLDMGVFDVTADSLRVTGGLNTEFLKADGSKTTLSATSPIFYNSGVISSQDASESRSGYVNATVQNFAGTKRFEGGAVFNGSIGGSGKGRNDAQLEISNEITGGHALLSIYNHLGAADEGAITIAAKLSNGTVSQVGATGVFFVDSIDTYNNYRVAWYTHLPDAFGDTEPLIAFSNNSIRLNGGATSTKPYNDLPPDNSTVIMGELLAERTTTVGGVESSGLPLIFRGRSLDNLSGAKFTKNNGTEVAQINVSQDGNYQYYSGSTPALKFQIDTLGAIRLPYYGSGLLQSDASGNVSTSTAYMPKSAGVSNPFTGPVYANSDIVFNNSAYIYSESGGSGLRSGIFFDGTAASLKSYTNGVLRYTQGSTGLNTWTGGGEFGGDVIVPDESYGSGWNGSLEAPTKNAVYDAIQSGTYTPTFTNGTNVNGNVFNGDFHYMRIGNEVTVEGSVTISATGAGNTVFDVSLPIASNFTNTYQLNGSGINNAPSIAGTAVARANTTNDRMSMNYAAISGGGQEYIIRFTYTIL